MMTREISLLLIVFTYLIAGCASTPVPDTYYSLSIGGAAAAPADSQRVTQIELTRIQLPDFLNQDGLVTQSGAHRVRAAQHHRWAESLDDAIGKVLLIEIMSQSESILVERNAGHFGSEIDCELRVEFDGFHTTDTSRVIANGRFWLHDGHKTVVKNFDYSGRLDRDGYAQVVAQLRASLTHLASGIIGEIVDNSACH